MRWLSRLRSLLRGLIGRNVVERDMDDEFRLHIELHTQRLIKAGLEPSAAARRARIEFGGIESMKEQGRESRGLRLFDEMRGDLRYGLRALLRSPAFTLVAVLTLALGIGANTAIFSALDAVLLRPLPFADPGALVELNDVAIPSRFDAEEEAPTSLDIRDIERMPEFTAVAAYAPGGLNLSNAGPPRRVRVGVVTTSFFETLGVRPIRGRVFGEDEGVPGGPNVAIVSHAFWRRHLGATDELEGRSIRLNGKRYAVVGVMPRGFEFPEQSEVWLPLSVPLTFAAFEPFRQYLPSRTIARLAPGVLLERAQARVHAVVSSYATADRPIDTTPAEHAEPLRASLVGQRRTALLVLVGATALVLLVACANVANLLLSRGAVRRRELAVRTAIGATPGRLVRQLLTESMLLAAIGGVLGIAIAFGGMQLLDALVPKAITGAAPLRIDARVLAFTIVSTLATGVLFGLLPALGARRTDAGDTLKSGSLAIAGGAQSARLRQAFVLTELALAVMLLIGSALMLRSLHALMSVQSGIEPERVATLELTLADADYPDLESRRRFYERVIETLERRPGIEAAAAINELPLRGTAGIRLNIFPEGRRPDVVGDEHFAQDLRITPGYFDVMGVRILRGRAPRPQPDTAGTREVAVSEAYAKLYWTNENPIGDRLELFREKYQIVGVVANVLPTSLESDVAAQMYFSLLDTPYDNGAIVARSRMSAARLTRMLEDAVREVAPTQAVYNVRTMEQVMANAIAPRRTNTFLIATFGLLSLVLAAIGVYGVIAFSVAHRTREIGIRLALGAQPRQVRWTILREAVVIAALGASAGLLGAWLLSRVLSGMIYGISATDPFAFIAAPTVLLLTATAAALVPAQRATRVDPVSAIRTE